MVTSFATLSLWSAGSVSSAVATPTDVIKVRMQARATGGLGGFLTVAGDIARVEGVGGLWKGVCPTAQRAALVAGVQLPAYDLVKQRLCQAGAGDGPVCHLVARCATLSTVVQT